MKERIDKCPICGNKKLAKEITCKDFMISGEEFDISKCTHCSFLFTNPRPTQKKLAEYYESDEYVSHADKSNSLTNSIYKIARKYTLKNKVKLINTLTKDRTLLDYGCGTGHFLSACKNKGWSITGFEPNENARTQATKHTGIDILSDLNGIEKLKDISVITLWHVLEHIPDLNEVFSILKSILTPKGNILIAVPNVHSYDANVYKEFWAAYDVPRHLYHFSPATMERFLLNHGLKLHQTIPMKLDSFYVSMLSEKYKYNRNNLIKSFLTGYKSNIYASRNQNNYSSLIYISGK